MSNCGDKDCWECNPPKKELPFWFWLITGFLLAFVALFLSYIGYMMFGL